MTKSTQFALNGVKTEAMPGETVLDVAKRSGINIPHLCHIDSLKAYGACRLCLVEVVWGKRSKLVTSCLYVPSEGDTVETDNSRVRRARAMVLELLLARCPSVEQIRELAKEYGIEQSRFTDESDENAEERCILCGLCIRVCDEIVGQHAISYANRGADRVITTPFNDNAEECIGCGACVFVCPTHALNYEDIDSQRVMKELHTTVPLFKCRVCGIPFVTERQLENISDRLGIPQDLAQTCPACRGREFRDTMANVLKNNDRGH
jgi:bidirectional [NiFe] hydrogenase diaphorase subunit